jgi:hypothetical protein
MKYLHSLVVAQPPLPTTHCELWPIADCQIGEIHQLIRKASALGDQQLSSAVHLGRGVEPDDGLPPGTLDSQPRAQPFIFDSGKGLQEESAPRVPEQLLPDLDEQLLGQGRSLLDQGPPSAQPGHIYPLALAPLALAPGEQGSEEGLLEGPVTEGGAGERPGAEVQSL